MNTLSGLNSICTFILLCEATCIWLLLIQVYAYSEQILMQTVSHGSKTKHFTLFTVLCLYLLVYYIASHICICKTILVIEGCWMNTDCIGIVNLVSVYI